MEKTDAQIIGGPVGKTWELTANLRWGCAGPETIPDIPSKRGGVLELQQLWRCRETHETEWRPIEVEP